MLMKYIVVPENLDVLLKEVPTIGASGAVFECLLSLDFIS